MQLNRRVITISFIAFVALMCGTTPSFRVSPTLAAEAEPQAPPVEASTAAASPCDFQADVPPVRRLIAHEFAGAEPDPESFDAMGLDQWWLRHQAETPTLARNRGHR
jgi:hypothetical protein